MTRQSEYAERAAEKLTVAEYGAVQAIARREGMALEKARRAEARAARKDRDKVETPAFLDGAVRGMIAAAGKRVANADPEDLANLLDLYQDLDAAVSVAIAGQRAQGHSWAQVGRAAGTTRQAAFQRWGSIERVSDGQ